MPFCKQMEMENQVCATRKYVPEHLYHHSNILRGHKTALIGTNPSKGRLLLRLDTIDEAVSGLSS
jgi:hypothetical protein